MTKNIANRSRHWTGTDAEYQHLHYVINKMFGKPAKCDLCSSVTAKRFEWANKSYRYLVDRSDWLRLCKSCHVKRDYVGQPPSDTCMRGHAYEVTGVYRTSTRRACRECIITRRRAAYRLKRGNKFVDKSERGLPTGVYRLKNSKRFMARSPGRGGAYLGVFDTAEQAKAAIDNHKRLGLD